jgi:hypothetical protein
MKHEAAYDPAKQQRAHRSYLRLYV